jgi:hypothetical protein
MASTTAGRAEASGWAVGFTTFAAVMLTMVGVFQFFEGLAAIIHSDFFVVGTHYTYKIDTTAWGWINMIWGAIVACAGFGLFAAKTWARVVGITVASLAAIAQFLYLPYYPLWAMLIIALCVICIWAIASVGRDDVAAY